jgi:hypothetical protein
MNAVLIRALLAEFMRTGTNATDEVDERNEYHEAHPIP